MSELKKVKKLLEQHQGKGNAISAGEIEKRIIGSTEDTHAKGRKLVERCAKEYGMPIAGDASGYYIITTQNELDEYEANLQSRIKKMKKRGKMMEKNFKEWWDK